MVQADILGLAAIQGILGHLVFQVSLGILELPDCRVFLDTQAPAVLLDYLGTQAPAELLGCLGSLDTQDPAESLDCLVFLGILVHLVHLGYQESQGILARAVIAGQAGILERLAIQGYLVLLATLALVIAERYHSLVMDFQSETY